MTSDLEMEKSLRKTPKLPHVPDANFAPLWMGPSYLSPVLALTSHNKGIFSLPMLLLLVFIPIPHWTGNCRNDGVWLQRLGYKRHHGFRLASITCVSPPGRGHVAKTLRQVYGEPQVWRDWGFLPTTSTALPVWWRNHLRGRFFSHSQALRRVTFWLWPHDRPWARSPS